MAFQMALLCFWGMEGMDGAMERGVAKQQNINTNNHSSHETILFFVRFD